MNRVNWNFLAGGVIGIVLMLLASNMEVPDHTSSTRAMLLVKNSSLSADICTLLPQSSNIGTSIKDNSAQYACVLNTRIDLKTKEAAVIKINTYPILTNIQSFKKNRSLGINYSLVEEICLENSYSATNCPKIAKILEKKQ